MIRPFKSIQTKLRVKFAGLVFKMPALLWALKVSL